VDSVKKLGRLSWYVAATLFNSTFTSLTVFGPAFIFYLNDLGLDKARIGLLLSLIPFAGIVAPMAATAVSRFGLKRTFVVFWGIRKAAFALILFVPTILRQLGTDTAYAWVAGIILAFSLCRAIAETGFYPWLQELIPNSIRGKFTAVNTIVSTLVALVTTAITSYVIDHAVGIDRFTSLFIVGLVCGLLAVFSYAMLPGETPAKPDEKGRSRVDEMRHALHNRNFVQFLLILAVVTLGGSVGGSFVALYANEQIGLSSGNVILLTIGASIGALISSYPLGWATDRYGSRPVMVLGLISSLVGPIGWLLMPRNSSLGIPLAMLLSFLVTLAGTAWGAGSGRYLFVNAVPADQKTGYMAVWYAWNAIIGGCGPLIAGWFLHQLSGLNLNLSGMAIDPYTPLFAFNIVTLIIGAFFAHRVQDDEALPLRVVLRMLFRPWRPHMIRRTKA
jgi:MFS family permease